jgi:hypothetical protein
MIYQTWNRTVAIALSVIFTFAPSLSAGQSKDNSSTKTQTTAANTAKPSQVASDEKASPGGPQEGIKVHGHWSIVIKNPDGSVASRHEFENSLAPPDGAGYLTRVMSRTATLGFYELSLVHSNAGVSPCGSVACTVSEPGGDLTATSTNLTVTGAQNPYATVLQGSFQAPSAGDIGNVRSFLTLCQPSVSPTACPGSGAFLFVATAFTSYQLPTPITVLAKQIVQVTVTYSFS